jgi:hypothetical protein
LLDAAPTPAPNFGWISRSHQQAAIPTITSSPTTQASAIAMPNFAAKEANFRIVDVGSLNGTYVNGESIHSAVLTNGDDIRMGKFRLMFSAWP